MIQHAIEMYHGDGYIQITVKQKDNPKRKAEA